MKRKRSKRTAAPRWTPFKECEPIVNAGLLDRTFLNNRYQVNCTLHVAQDVPGGRVLQLSVKRRDKAPMRDWRNMQRIKNEVVSILASPLWPGWAWGRGEDCEAAELYPAEDRLVDCANQYHLWVLRPGVRFPFGFDSRAVTEHIPAGGRQRAFDPGQRPEDCIPKDVLMAAVEAAVRKLDK